MDWIAKKACAVCRNGHFWSKNGVAALCAATALVLLGGCGGGGGGGTDVAPVTVYAPSSQLAAQCVLPRSGVNPATGFAYADVQGTLANEKSWVRSWLDETYLWYRDIPAADPSAYGSVVAYFAALKTPAKTPSGNDRDRFHFTYTTTDWLALSQTGTAVGYGIGWEVLSSTVPRSVVVAQVGAGSPAAVAGIGRGAQILAVDGVDLVRGSDTATLNAGLFPAKVGESHQLTVRDVGATATRNVTLTSAAVTLAPVPLAKTLDTTDGSVGYLLFNEHVATAELQLVDGVRKLAAAGIRDLVLDLRYNGGGYLAIASQLAYMIAGATPTKGAVFEKLLFNDRNPFKLTDAEATTPFYDRALGYSFGPAGAALPTLNLSRVFVLTSAATCSASESVINSLRGVGVEVILIGGTTCGKPFGFIPQDNCGTTYFAIQFQGVNHKGFGSYEDGFGPQCTVPDDFSHALGDAAEARLAAALQYRSSRTCPQQADTPVRAALAEGLPASGADSGGLARPTYPGRVWGLPGR